MRSGGPVRPTRRTVPARTRAPVPIVEAVTITPMEEEDIPNEGALQALKPEDNLDQVPTILFLLLNFYHLPKHILSYSHYFCNMRKIKKQLLHKKKQFLICLHTKTAIPRYKVWPLFYFLYVII